MEWHYFFCGFAFVVGLYMGFTASALVWAGMLRNIEAKVNKFASQLEEMARIQEKD
jgi:hypothetical protein